MTWDGSGNFSRFFGSSGWANDKNAAINILASRHDTHDQDMADGVNACMTRDNQAKPTVSFKPNSDNALDLGSTALRWVNVWASTAFKIKQASFLGSILSATLTADRNWTFPDFGGLVGINAQGANIASAATINLDTATGDYVHLTGTTTCTAITLAQGSFRKTITDGAMQFTNGASLICLGRVNITSNAGDIQYWEGEAAGIVRMVGYFRADGNLLTNVLSKSIFGLTYAINGVDPINDIDFAAGGAIDSTGLYFMAGQALTKQLDVVWAVGNNAGMLDTGAVGNNEYYLWEIARSDTGVVDYLASLSATAPTMPTNYNFKRLIGYLRRLAGVNTLFDVYEQTGGGIYMQWRVPTLDIDLTNTLSTSRRTDAVKVPTSFSVEAHLNCALTDAAATQTAWLCCPDQTDAAPSGSAAPLANLYTNVGPTLNIEQLFIITSATGTIAARTTVATADNYRVSTMGFIWSRRN